MSWLDGLSTALTARTKGASGWLEGQQRGRKEAEDRAKEIAAMLRQKRIDEQNALMQNAQLSHLAKQTELMGVPKPAEGFTLAPRARRYDAEGKLIAEGAPDEPQGINPYQERVLAQGDARLKLAREAAARAGQGGQQAARIQQTYKKQAQTLDNLKDAIKTYRDQLTSSGIEVMPGEKKSLLTGAYANLKLLAKEAANLGALTGPDVVILEELFNDPATLGSAALNVIQRGGRAKGLLKQLDQYESIINGNRARLEQNYPGYGGGAQNETIISEAQKDWDEAVAIHGKDKVLKEFGPRPEDE